MTTQSATLAFALPEDIDSDFLTIYSSATRDGTYDLVLTVDYEYGTTKYEFDDLDDTLWYRIRFLNSQDNETGPASDPVYGGTFTAAAPFLAISTTADGANYATTQDLYDYSDLTPEDISTAKVSAALRSARAKIDYRTSSMGLDRFQVFTEEVARRKYNATLRILKEAEINIALGVVYDNLSDNLILANTREDSVVGSGSISIGATSLSGDSLAERGESILYLSTLAAKYEARGEQLLSSLDATSVVLVGYDDGPFIRSPRFRWPFNGYSNVAGIG